MPGNGLPTLLDMLVEESNPDADTTDYTASGKIRHRLLRGEAISRDDPAARYGVSKSLLDQVAKIMGKCGWDFEWVEVEGGTACRLVDPSRPIDEAKVRAYMEESREKAAKDNARKAERKAEEKRARERAARKLAREAEEAASTRTTDVAVNGVSLASPPPPPPPPPAGLDHFPLDGVPSLDTELTVYLVARNLDGTMTVGLRNGSRAWVATLTGVTAVES